ncbi:ArgP/LysG family DNA-binding transcriptional regulator [Cellulosimicrobium protaetiae]|uniref:ArgP/LysG family DNA-binding transcriptional regulator n=1 Tax=Cellulosimicrobium protaetiae TaxID=2587808 RepID=A0A6M5U9B9_9MICO|nr:ArgP/LysG family DNA-binding transcriptional regulator [Cellulosimicrobium protaetiae]QJW35086.1 ArgP/LysG family DNA-binding transcriptional regulator [Cellulosimicrobium protaetiae]
MVDLQPDQLRTLATIAAAGTFEAAAHRLGVTPSAVSQRVRALESAVGQVLVRRGKPAELTGPGEVLVRHARHLALQQADVLAELGIGATEPARDPSTDDDGAPLPEITLVVSGDALTTWALPALVEASGWARLEILREDEEHSIGLLRDGTAVAAVTSVAEAVPGCRSTLLGRMRYRPMASPAFAARWFPDGPTPAALSRAPVLAFDRKDDLQERYLRVRAQGAGASAGTAAGVAFDPPRHHVPASNEFRRAIELGMGWGMLPDLQSARAERAGRLVGFDDARAVDVPQHWQQWRLHSTSLDRLATAVARAARAALGAP